MWFIGVEVEQVHPLLKKSWIRPCEQKPHLVYGFRAGARAIRYNLSMSTGYVHKNQTRKWDFYSHI